METIFRVDRLLFAYFCDLTSHFSLGCVLPDPTEDHFRVKSAKGTVKSQLGLSVLCLFPSQAAMTTFLMPNSAELVGLWMESIGFFHTVPKLLLARPIVRSSPTWPCRRLHCLERYFSALAENNCLDSADWQVSGCLSALLWMLHGDIGG